MWITALVFLVAWLLSSCGIAEQETSYSYAALGEAKALRASVVAEESEVIQDEIIIKVKEGEDVMAVAQAVAQKTGGSVIKVFEPYALIKIDAGISAQNRIFMASADSRVEMASQNKKIRIPKQPREDSNSRLTEGFLGTLRKVLFTPLSVSPNPQIPNDPRFNELWGIYKILAPQAWNAGTGSSQVIVAVLDTGIDYNHPDLIDNMWKNSRETCRNNVDDDNNGYIDDCYGIDTASNDGDPMDNNGHGTHVAGIIGAVGDNAIGVAGVNWRVKILACKFIDSDGGGSLADMIECINYLINLKRRGENILVVNASYGSYDNSPNPIEQDAINNLRNNGILLVAGAGNEAWNNDSPVERAYPCSFSKELDNVICVASIGRSNLLSFFSNYGANTVQVAAPGSGILSTAPNRGYAVRSGTSMSAPYVAGLAALIKAVNPNFSYLDIRQRILSTVDPSPSLQSKVSTGGKINVYRALGGTNPTLLVNPIGSGSVSGGGIDCGNVCATAYATGSSVSLSASSQSGATRLDWGGDCSSCGREDTCIITMDATKNCFVTFYTASSIDEGGSATVGLQSPPRATRYRYNTGGIASGLALDFVYQGTDYTVNPTTFRYRYASSPNLINFQSSDDDFVSIDTPFPIRFYGALYSRLYVSTNGLISFGSGTSEPTNTDLPNNGMPPMIAAFWDDLFLDLYSRVYWHVEGGAPNRLFVITYENVGNINLTPSPSVEDGITFQVIFYENQPNRITLQYADTRFFGAVVAVSKSGVGSGTVSASTGNLNCGALCSDHYGFYAKVKLNANASQGSSFSGWTGDCSACGSNQICEVEVNKSKFCLAQFIPASPVSYTLTANIQGGGSGTITSDLQGINCGQTCSAIFFANTEITLTASPAQGFVFVGWGGDCVNCGNNSQCQITMNSNKTCFAIFSLPGATGVVITSRGGGCSMGYNASSVNALLWLLLPMLMLVRKIQNFRDGR